MVLYRTKLPAGWSATNATLQLGAPVHDYAKVRVHGPAGVEGMFQVGDHNLGIALRGQPQYLETGTLQNMSDMSDLSPQNPGDILKQPSACCSHGVVSWSSLGAVLMGTALSERTKSQLLVIERMAMMRCTALRSLPGNLIGSPTNYANRSIGSSITSRSTGVKAPL